MRIKVSGTDFAEAFEIDVVTETDYTSVQPMTERNADGSAGDTKLVDDRPVYRVPCVIVDRSNGYQIGSATLKVHEKPKGKLARGFDKRLMGDIYITPWVARGSNRISLSIVAEGISDGTASQAGK